jgi:glutamate transport system substrate-binding protein
VSTDQLILYGVATTDQVHLAVSGVTFGEQERYGIGIRHGDEAACMMLTAKIREFIVDGYWGRFFTQNFPGLNPNDYKPDPYSLDACE